MINRRELLIAMSAAALGAAATTAPALAELLEPGLEGWQNPAPAGQAKQVGDHAADERLRTDLARLMPRANSEEGVPMFLACINLVPDNTSHKVTAIRPSALSTEVAAEFRRTAAAWERIRPNPTVADVAEVIVVMADRDFRQGGKEQTS